MSEQCLGFKVRRLLDDVEPEDSKAYLRLCAIRQEALARQKGGQPSHILLPLEHATAFIGTTQSLFSRFLIPTLALVLGLMAIQSWNQFQTAEEIEEIDAAVLTGELPIDAYVDSGFDLWLKRSSQ